MEYKAAKSKYAYEARMFLLNLCFASNKNLMRQNPAMNLSVLHPDRAKIVREVFS